MTPVLHRCAFALLLCSGLFATSCHKKEPQKPKSAKRQRENAIQQASEEQKALNAFVASVRDVMTWQQSQPISSDSERQRTIQSLAGKMEKVPVKDLPDDLSSAWTAMLQSWRALAKTSKPDAALIGQGAKAAEELNHQLAARGVIDLRF